MTLRTPIADSSVLIAGMARDVAPFVRGEIERLLHCAKDFKKVQVLVIESDSSDNTLQELNALKLDNFNFNYVSFGKLSSTIKSRTERIAYCRNQVLRSLRENALYADVDFVMLADLDGLNNLLTPQKIKQCWGIKQDWDGIFANQADHYYDIYALRRPDWSPNDCGAQQLRLEPVLGRSLAHHLAVKSKQICLSEKLDLIEVESAFGGFGIYKKAAFLSGVYIGGENGVDICEHVSFHLALRAHGHKLYINPALINCDQPINLSARLKRRLILNVIKTVARSLLGRARFNKYLDFLRE